MTNQVSYLSLAAAGVYILVTATLVVAASTASSTGQKPAHRIAWLGLALVFATFVFLRLLNLEEAMRAELRQVLIADRMYDHRRDIQRPIAAAAIALFGVAGIVGAYVLSGLRESRRDLAVGIGVAAGIGLIGLAALRILSLHAIDVLLYGPLKLNWFADLGLAMVAGIAAMSYRRFAIAGTNRR